MKVTCLLTSYNRPTFVAQALESVAKQSHRDYELIVLDESTLFDIHKVVARFQFPSVKVRHWKLTPEERRETNRLSVKINAGLEEAAGEVICYLCDDDFFHPKWFENATRHFAMNPAVKALYGKLIYTQSRTLAWPAPRTGIPGRREGYVLFRGFTMSGPPLPVDHNQVMHAKIDLRWSELRRTLHHPDAIFFEQLAPRYPLHPVEAWACAKRIHSKNLQFNMDAYFNGPDALME